MSSFKNNKYCIKKITVVDNNINSTLSRVQSGFNMDSQKIVNKDFQDIYQKF